MAFARPTLQELIDRIGGDFKSRLEFTGALLRRSVVAVIARVIAGAAHLIHGHLDWISRQILPDTMDDDYLIRFAGMFGLSKTAATFAAGSVTFTGVDDSVIPAGTVIVRADGVEYETDADGTIAAGTVDVAATCKTAGETGNADEGTALTLQSPIGGVDSVALVAAGDLTNGADEESTDSLRARTIIRLQSQPTGGSEDDYINWALEVAEVTRVWIYPNELGPGKVTIRFMTDDAAGGPIPDAGKVAEVQAYIDERAPVTAIPVVVAPIADPLDITVSLNPDTSAIRAAVEAELADFILRESEPGGTTYLSRLNEAISAAQDEFDHTVTIPAADVTRTTGYIATLGVVTYA